MSIRLHGHYRFKGAILLAPSLEFKTPNPVITGKAQFLKRFQEPRILLFTLLPVPGLLELTYATFAPGDEMPDWLMKPREKRAITWQEEVVEEQAEQDKW